MIQNHWAGIVEITPTGKALLGSNNISKEIPNIIFQRLSNSHSFSGVNNTAAANSLNKGVDLLAF